MIYSDERLTFNILSIDVFINEKGFYRINGRPYAALALRIEGEGRFKAGEARFTSKAGDITFIPQNADYDVEYDGGKCLVFHLSDCNYTEPENFSVKRFAFYKALAEETMSEWKTKFCANGVKSAVYRILQLVNDEFSSAEEQAEDRCFTACLQYVRENFRSGNLSLSELCRKFYISEASLRRKFRRYCNLSFKQYLMRLRFDNAFTMLGEGKHSVAEVARQCGFEDEKYFSRAVKKKFGISPSALRNS